MPPREMLPRETLSYEMLPREMPPYDGAPRACSFRASSFSSFQGLGGAAAGLDHRRCDKRPSRARERSRAMLYEKEDKEGILADLRESGMRPATLAAQPGRPGEPHQAARGRGARRAAGARAQGRGPMRIPQQAGALARRDRRGGARAGRAGHAGRGHVAPPGGRVVVARRRVAAQIRRRACHVVVGRRPAMSSQYP